MTMNQAAALRVRWNQRVYPSSDCAHLNLDLEWDDLGHSTGHYTCIICGESVAPRASIHVAFLQAPAPSTARYPHCDY